MHLLVWIAFCFALSIFLQSRPAVGSIVVIVSYLALPAASSLLLTGKNYDSSLGIHPATWLLAILSLVTLLRRPGDFWLLSRERSSGAKIAVLVVILAALITHNQRHFSGFSQIADCYVAPVLLVLQIQRGLARGLTVAHLRSVVLLAGFVIALVLTLEFSLGHDLLWQNDYAQTYPAYNAAINGYRPSASLDNPLNAALFLLICVPVAVRHKLWRIPTPLAVLLLLVGIAATSGRFAAVAAVVYLVGRSTVQVIRRPAGFIAWLIVSVVAVIAVSRGIVGSNLSERFQNDHGSSAIRSNASQLFFQDMSPYYVTGGGVGSSSTVSEGLTGTNHSFENAYIMDAVDIGIPLTLLWVASLGLMIGGRPRESVTRMRAPAMLALVACASFSSSGTKSSAEILVALAICLSGDVPLLGRSSSPKLVDADTRAMPELVAA